MKSFSDADTQQNNRIAVLESDNRSTKIAVKVALCLATAAFTFCVCLAFS